MYGAEFLLDGMAVGLFKDGAYPRVAGRYPYEPYRGPGHYEMVTRVRAGRVARCYYDQGELRVSFSVRALPGYGMIETDDFEHQDIPH